MNSPMHAVGGMVCPGPDGPFVTDNPCVQWRDSVSPQELLYARTPVPCGLGGALPPPAFSLGHLWKVSLVFAQVSPGDTGWDVFSLDYHVDGPIATVSASLGMWRALSCWGLQSLSQLSHQCTQCV